jgi:hypothetical protein
LLWAALVAGGAGPGTAYAQGAPGRPGCTFVLGFAALHDALPQVVGPCLEDERHDPQTGDALQATANGLLVWRKADDWTAFTDGYRTWTAGPRGRQTRLNGQRFWWEADPQGLPVVPAPRPGDRCHTAGLALAPVPGGGDAGAGHAGMTLRFTNTLSVPCTFSGYPGAQRLDAAGDALPTRVVRGNGYLFRDPGPGRVTVPPGGAAAFGLEWGQVPTGGETTCPPAGMLQVTPPDEYSPLTIPATFTACDGGRLNVTAVRPPA